MMNVATPPRLRHEKVALEVRAWRGRFGIDLWGLAQTVEVLVDEIGAEELPAWLLAEPHRRELLRSRRHRELAREAVTGAAVRGAYADPRGRALRDRASLGYDEGEA